MNTITFDNGRRRKKLSDIILLDSSEFQDLMIKKRNELVECFPYLVSLQGGPQTKSVDDNFLHEDINDHEKSKYK